MAEIEESETRKEGQGFKLFGKTIPLEINKKVKEEIKVVQHQQQQEGESSGRSSSSSSSSSRPDKTIPCPRCKSMETKFCYFNNYNVNQPRHFCKGCQRYWTAGGSLRNVPVGAGRRKTKPSCHGSIGFSGDCVFDASSTTVREIEFDRVVVEQWHVAAATAAASSGGFRHVFPGKRHCTGPFLWCLPQHSLLHK